MEEGDPDLNEMEDIRFDEIREDRWRDLAEEKNDKKKIHALRWNVYVKEQEEIITRALLVSVPHPKGGTIVWTCVKDHVIDEKEDHKDIGIRGFDYRLFEEEEGRGKLEVLDGSPYLKHLIKLWPGDWEKQMKKKNEAVCMKNRVTLNGGGKRQVKNFTRQEFWKFIGFILSSVTYGKKGCKLWSELSKGFGKYDNLTLRRDVRGTTNLYKVCCARYRHLYIYVCD